MSQRHVFTLQRLNEGSVGGVVDENPLARRDDKLGSVRTEAEVIDALKYLRRVTEKIKSDV